MPTKVKSGTTDSPTEIVALTSRNGSLNLSLQLSATPGCRNRNKKRTCKSKGNTYSASIPVRSACQISDPASTTKEKGFAAYWNERYEEKSCELLSPIGIGSFASDSISLNTSSPCQVGKSWCSISSIPLRNPNLSETSLQSSLSSAPVSTDCEVTRSRRILLKPTSEQRLKLKAWMAGYRKAWTPKLLESCPYLKDIPPHILYGAMLDADKSYKSVISKRTKGKVAALPRCRKKTQRSFYMLGNAVVENGMYPRKLGKMKAAEPLPHKPSDGRVICDCGRWYLSITYRDKVKVSDSQGRICSIDPGVRTFATVLGTDGLHKVGLGQFGRIVRIASYLDGLLSRAASSCARKRRRMLQAAAHMRRKITRLVDDMHYQAIGWLMRNYDTIVIPEACFTGACKKGSRKIRRKTVRVLMTWSFRRFVGRLVHKCKLFSKNLVIVNEAWTSKTANWTGEIVSKLGGSKTITSNGVTVDRDANGALGIMLKALVDHPALMYRNR